ncbi:MAG: hypothetical protein Q8P28_04310 [Deltaproteobacteria bacterium]|nr:hypothetical protein [Deltaproteobacteria bacterium]
MNLQKIKDHFPEYSDMKIGEFFKYMHKTYYPDMKITDMYRALLKLTQIVKKEEVKEDPKAEEEVKPEPKAKEDDKEEPIKPEKDLDKIISLIKQNNDITIKAIDAFMKTVNK